MILQLSSPHLRVQIRENGHSGYPDSTLESLETLEEEGDDSDSDDDEDEEENRMRN